MSFYLVEKNSKFMLHILQVFYMCTLCDSTNINTIIKFDLICSYHVTGNGFKGRSVWYLPVRNTHAHTLLKECTPSSNGIVRGWLFPEFGAELQLDNCTLKITLNIYIYIYIYRAEQQT